MKKAIAKMKYMIKFPFMDIGRPEDTIILAGMGRSGTTWAADVINYDRSYRIVFEPYSANKS